MAIAGVERFRANPHFASQRASPVNARGLLASRAFLIAIHARASAFFSGAARRRRRARLAVRRNGVELGGEPPASLIALITDNKQAVVHALQRAEAEADRWRFVLREKSDLVMRARGSPEYESRCEAYGIILVEYLNGYMLDTDPRVCAWCGKPDLPLTPTLPFGLAIVMRGFISIAATGGARLVTRPPSRHWRSWGSWSRRKMRPCDEPATRHNRRTLRGRLLCR